MVQELLGCYLSLCTRKAYEQTNRCCHRMKCETQGRFTIQMCSNTTLKKLGKSRLYLAQELVGEKWLCLPAFLAFTLLKVDTRESA